MTGSRNRFAMNLPTIALVALAALLAAGASFAENAKLPLPLIRVEGSEMLPPYAFEQRGPDGKSLDRGFVDYLGAPIVAIAWATWCGVCRGEMPKLDKLAKEMKSSGLVVLALSIDDGGLEVAERALKDRKLPNLRTVHDTKKMFFSMIGAWGVPTTVIADAEGRIVARANGPVPWEAPEVRAFLRSLAKPATESAKAH